MFKKLKHALTKKNNDGSSFVLVIVSTTFMCILAAAILMAALMTYKLKYYKLNSINNFYEVEKALDEIYAGVGATVNEHLYSAYTTTAELVVTYDTENQVYTTLDNDTANTLFKKLFMAGFISDSNYKTLGGVTSDFQTYISNPYDAASNTDGVVLSVDKLQLVFTDNNGYTKTQYYDNSGTKLVTKVTKDNGFNEDSVESITFKNICVKRSVEITGGTTNGTYVQSIMTDIVLREPEYSVSFNTYGGSSSSLYDYAILADMGIEITGSDTSTAENGTNVTVNGNLYVASDYYNKSYNSEKEIKVTTKYDSEPSIKWGSTDKSIYSGLFVSGDNTTLTLNSDLIVCSGSLTSYNGADIKLMGRTQNTAELWTDSIVIGGSEKGGNITATADAYVYDDTELNAQESSLIFNGGRYFGYSYNAKDTRDISFIKEKGLASNFDLKSHFSDSAIIVNGKDSELDLENLTSLYIAGKSYIEFSRVAGSLPEGTEDNGTQYYDYTTLTDYSTGQSLDVKTNQLIFLTQWEVKSENATTGIVTLKVPTYVGNNAAIKKLYEKYFIDGKEDNGVYAIKQEVSGHTYYYLYLADDSETGGTSRDQKAQEFAELYYSLLNPEETTQTNTVYNVRKYNDFDVTLLLPDADAGDDTTGIAAGGLVTDQNSADSWLYFRDEKDTTLDVYKSLQSAATERTFATLLGNGVPLGSGDAQSVLADIDEKASKNTADYVSGSKQETASSLLDYMYINLKDHLSVLDSEETQIDGTVKEVSAWDTAGYTKEGDSYTYSLNGTSNTYSFNYSLTPLTTYVNYEYVMTKNLSVDEAVGDARVIIAGRGSGDVTVKNYNGSGEVKGVIIATGDVSFASDVTRFTGIIITGGKVIVDHSMTFSADNAMVSSVLAKCAKSTNSAINQLTSNQGTTGANERVLKQYKVVSDSGEEEDGGMSISDITYEDILTFENWKKNVD